MARIGSRVSTILMMVVLILVTSTTSAAAADTEAPMVTGVQGISSNEIEVTYSEPVEQVTAQTTSNYSIDGFAALAVTAAVQQTDLSKVRLSVSPNQTAGETYSVTVTGVKDSSGNELAADGSKNVVEFVGWGLSGSSAIEFAKVAGGNNQVELEWKAVEGATSYRLSRSTDGVNWGSALYAGPGLAFTDTGVTNYTNYFYKLEVSDGSVTVTSHFARAFPPDVSPHGYYAKNTGLCASCHVTHAAQGPTLMKENSVVALCTACHDGTGSKYNVLNGEVLTAAGWKASPAGPFGQMAVGGEAVNTLAPYNYNGSQTVSQVPTSIHNVGNPHQDAPGNMISNTFLQIEPMECNNCHDPHNDVNYRMLNANMQVHSGAQQNVVEAYAVTGPSGENVNYVSGSVSFCGYCHSDFNQGAGSARRYAKSTQQVGFMLGTDSVDKVMHAVNVDKTFNGTVASWGLPDVPYENNKIICLTCHRAHGTTVVGVNDTRSGGSSTSLKRADGSKICEDCHHKNDFPEKQ